VPAQRSYRCAPRDTVYEVRSSSISYSLIRHPQREAPPSSPARSATVIPSAKRVGELSHSTQNNKKRKSLLSREQARITIKNGDVKTLQHYCTETGCGAVYSQRPETSENAPTRMLYWP